MVCRGKDPGMCTQQFELQRSLLSLPHVSGLRPRRSDSLDTLPNGLLEAHVSDQD